MFIVEACSKCGCSPKGVITGEARARVYQFKCCQTTVESENIQIALDHWNRINKSVVKEVKVEGRLVL